MVLIAGDGAVPGTKLERIVLHEEKKELCNSARVSLVSVSSLGHTEGDRR